jgi:hypothetical protein
MPLLFTTSATAASLLIAVFAFVHRLNVDLRREAHEAMVTYYRARTNCEDEIERKLSSTGAMNTNIGGKMDETDDYRYEWTHEKWDPATSDMTHPEWLQKDRFGFYKSYLYTDFTRGTKSDALLNFADSSTLENRVFKTMRENGMDSYMWFIWVFLSHSAGSHTGILHLQSVYASSLPKKIELFETTLRYIPWSIFIFTVVLFLSAIAIFDAGFSIFAVEAYAAGWILVLGIVKRLSSLVTRTRRKLRLHTQVKLKRRL